MTDGKEGLLVSPKNDKALADALRKILSDRSLRFEMGARGILTSHEYDWRKVARRVYDYYLKTLREHPEFESHARSKTAGVSA
jgi:glycosyltransferase involved in cell wall biosynthesis